MLRDLNIYTMDYTYLRNRNHITDGLEARLASMYGAGKVFLTNSCMEAVTSLLEYLLPDRGKVVVNRDTYYETRQWLNMVKRYTVIEVDCMDLGQVEEAVQGADILYFDDPSFFMDRHPVKALVDIAHKAGAKVIVDNTVLSVYYNNPIAAGADYVVESYSKYLAGHGDVMAGGIVCKDEPDPSLALFLGRRGRVVDAFTVFLLERSLETLQVRMEKHTENGRYVFNKLLEAGVACWYSGDGGCIILPGLDEGFCDKLAAYGHFRKAPTFGTTYSTTSFVRSPELYRVGSYARLSCGLEDKETLWHDVWEALGHG